MEKLWGLIKKLIWPILLFVLILGMLAYSAFYYVSATFEAGINRIKQWYSGISTVEMERSSMDAFEWRDENVYSLRLEELPDDETGELVWFVVEKNLTEDTEEAYIELDKYLERGENFDKLFKAGCFDTEGMMLLMSDDDIDKIFQKIYDDTHVFERGYEKKYHWIKKVAERGTHEEPVYDADWNPVVDPETGEPVTREVEDSYASWMPDDKWEHKLETEEELKEHFYIENEKVMMYEDSIKGEVDEMGFDRFVMRWQMALGLMEMIGYNQYDTWGDEADTLGGGKTPVEGNYARENSTNDYYLSDDIIEQVINHFSYTYEWWWDCYPTDENDEPVSRSYKYPDFEYIGYTLDFKEMETLFPEEGDEAYIHKIPAAAPKVITNGWETIEYIYEDSEDEYSSKICTGRNVYWDAKKFYNWIIEIAPEFDWEWYIETVEMMPGSTNSVDIIKKLYMVYQMQEAEGTDEPILMVEGEDCPQVGVRLGDKIGEEIATPEPDYDFGDIDYAHGNFDFVYVKAHKMCKSTGWVAIPEGAHAILTESDNLSLEEIERIMAYFQDRYDSGGTGAYKGAWMTAADELYAWQSSTGYSITGMLAIWMSEGGPSSRAGKDHWNFGNYVAGDGDPYYLLGSSGYHWKDIKAMKPNFGDAVTYQLDDIARRYWQRGQNTYYSMSWWCGDHEYSAQSEEEAEFQFTQLSHCYCPYWDDQATVAHEEKSIDPAYRGWCGNNALNRETLLSIAHGG